EPDSPAPSAASAAPDQATQVLDAIRLAACPPYVGAFFNFLLADEPTLTGRPSGALWADLTRQASYPAFPPAVPAARSGAGAIDAASNLGDASAGATVTTPDLTAPSTVTAFTAQPAGNPGRVELQWQAATDNVGVASYELSRDGALIATVAGTSYGDTHVVAL